MSSKSHVSEATRGPHELPSLPLLPRPHVRILELQDQNNLITWQPDALEGGTDPQLTVS